MLLNSDGNFRVVNNVVFIFLFSNTQWMGGVYFAKNQYCLTVGYVLVNK
jgi:hypothetical protein